MELDFKDEHESFQKQRKFIQNEINNIITYAMFPEEKNLFNMVRREILASEDIVEMLPPELRVKAKLVNESLKDLKGHPEVALQRSLNELMNPSGARSRSVDNEKPRLTKQDVEGSNIK